MVELKEGMPGNNLQSHPLEEQESVSFSNFQMFTEQRCQDIPHRISIYSKLNSQLSHLQSPKSPYFFCSFFSIKVIQDWE